MIPKSRQKLPYRKTCEGYLFYKGKILARYVNNVDPSKRGFLMFPGGGIDEGESPEKAMRREAFEETGAILPDKLSYLGKIHFDWDEDWIKTEKQRARYKIFRGEEMYFFRCDVLRFAVPKGDPSDVWKGEKFMDIDEVIQVISAAKPFPKNMKRYMDRQLKQLEIR